MALMEIVMSPRSSAVGISHLLVPAMRILNASGLPHETHAMGTIVQGDATELLELAGKMHAASFGPDVPRVVMSIKIDDRRDKPQTLTSKTDSLARRLAEDSDADHADTKDDADA